MGELSVDVFSIGLLSVGALSIYLPGAHVLSVDVKVAIVIGVDVFVPGVIGTDICRQSSVSSARHLVHSYSVLSLFSAIVSAPMYSFSWWAQDNVKIQTK
jgi:hypothetical protein